MFVYVNDIIFMVSVCGGIFVLPISVNIYLTIYTMRYMYYIDYAKVKYIKKALFYFIKSEYTSLVKIANDI